MKPLSAPRMNPLFLLLTLFFLQSSLSAGLLRKLKQWHERAFSSCFSPEISTHYEYEETFNRLEEKMRFRTYRQSAQQTVEHCMRAIKRLTSKKVNEYEKAQRCDFYREMIVRSSLYHELLTPERWTLEQLNYFYTRFFNKLRFFSFNKKLTKRAERVSTQLLSSGHASFPSFSSWQEAYTHHTDIPLEEDKAALLTACTSAETPLSPHAITHLYTSLMEEEEEAPYALRAALNTLLHNKNYHPLDVPILHLPTYFFYHFSEEQKDEEYHQVAAVIKQGLINSEYLRPTVQITHDDYAFTYCGIYNTYPFFFYVRETLMNIWCAYQEWYAQSKHQRRPLVDVFTIEETW